MAHSKEPSNNDLQFHWGKKRGIGGAKKDILFYESFTFDGVVYSLYDCVYVFKKGEPEPYIGKIMKVWEQPDHRKKIKLLWFFHPNELLNYLGDHAPLEKEIFLASGEGVGAFNVNPLEAIAGKCSVICTSKDERNPQPSKEALEMADYIFYRTFDVGSYIISEILSDIIVGVDVKYLLNRLEDCKSSSFSKLETHGIDGKRKAYPSMVSRNLSKSESLRSLENKAKGSKLGHVPSSISREDVKEGRHLNESKYLSEKGDPSVSDYRPSKKMRLSVDSVRPSDDLQNTNSTVTRKLKFDSDEHVSGKDLVRLQESSENIILSKKKASPAVSVEDEIKVDNQILEVIRRPDVDRSKWFKQAPWESRIQNADGHGTLVLLDNLNPSYTSGDIEGIIYHAFKQSCTARIIPQATFQNPHYGQAYVIFKTPDAADLAIRKINVGCLMLPNGRPVMASRGRLEIPPKSSKLDGHLVIDKIRRLMHHHEWKKAVATAHCSQPNTIEYEMAMDWILVQEKSISWFNRLHKVHGDELDYFKKRFTK